MPQKQFNARQKKALWTSVALVAATALAVITWLPGWENFRKPSSDVSARMKDEDLAAATATMQPLLTLPATRTPRGMTPAPTGGAATPTPKNGNATAPGDVRVTPTPKPTRTPAGMTAAPGATPDATGASGKAAAKATAKATKANTKATPKPTATPKSANPGKATAAPPTRSGGPVSDARSVSLQPLTLMDNRNARIIVPTLHGFANQAIEGRVNEGIEKRLNVDELVKTAEELAQENSSGHSWEVSLRYKGERLGQVYHICATSYTYSGGAHGSSTQTHLYIDATTGDFYDFDDLFTDPASAKKMLTDEIDAAIAKEGDKFLDGAKAAPLPDNFIIEDDKLVIVYPMNAIAPYVAGFPEFEIEYSRLEPLLNREGTFWKALTIKI